MDVVVLLIIGHKDLHLCLVFMGKSREFWALVLFLSSREQGSCVCAHAHIRDGIERAKTWNPQIVLVPMSEAVQPVTMAQRLSKPLVQIPASPGWQVLGRDLTSLSPSFLQ